MFVERKMQFTGSVFILIAIVSGAFGSHALKSVLNSESLDSFETGVRYLMYNGLALLLLSRVDYSGEKAKRIAFYLVSLGTLLFSGSIFILTLRDYIPFSTAFLVPITPIGGSLLIIAWIYNTLIFFKGRG